MLAKALSEFSDELLTELQCVLQDQDDCGVLPVRLLCLLRTVSLELARREAYGRRARHASCHIAWEIGFLDFPPYCDCDCPGSTHGHP